MDYAFSELSALRSKSPKLFKRSALHGHLRGIDYYPAADFIEALLEGIRLFEGVHGRPPKLASPESFSDHVFCRKYFGALPIPSLGDKLNAREYARVRVGETYMPKIAWAGRSLSDLDVSSLKPGKYVFKATHGSGFTRMVTLPDDFPKRFDELKGAEVYWKSQKFGYSWGEWHYSCFEPMVFLEEFLNQNSLESPHDFKFYCFNGRVRLIHVDTDRFSGHRRAFYTPQWVKLNATTPPYPLADAEKPKHLEEMIEIAETISSDLPFARIDLYETDNGVKFGEVTLTPLNASQPYHPYAFDLELGKCLHAEPDFSRWHQQSTPALWPEPAH